MPFNEIVIHRGERGYKVEFPYKPGKSAIRGFHGIGMTWQTFESAVIWHIPAERLADAVDFIGYWFTEKPESGRDTYGVRVEEEKDESSLIAGLDRLMKEAA
jgi:hypothetical protein